jgi:hypothetical protein
MFDKAMKAKMGTCWAESDGQCGGGKSREHMVSKGLFLTPGIRVHGLKWCKSEPKSVGVNSLTATILCRAHNSNLASLDAEAVRTFDALRRHFTWEATRKEASLISYLAKETPVINAKLLERWLLKTLINLTYRSKFMIGLDGTEAGIPSKSLIDIAYGKQRFNGEAGMYIAANTGMTFASSDTVKFAPLIKDDAIVLGGFFEFRGMRIFLSLLPARATPELVIPPFLMRALSRGYAASASFCFGVMPPMPVLGRS